MKSIKDVFKYGPGPSSSHTMGPQKACLHFIDNFDIVGKISVVLYGSLAFTGKGHLTDYIIEQTLKQYDCEISFNFKEKKEYHENAMLISNNGNNIVYYSVGGGDIHIEIDGIIAKDEFEEIYKENNFQEIKNTVHSTEELLAYIYENEPKLKKYLNFILDKMFESVESGLEKEGELPGVLHVKKKAKYLYEEDDRELRLSAYAYAVSEENASGQFVVTAPTCGACGVLPAILYFNYKTKNISKDTLIDALAISGLFGLIVKTNASISGAEAGCQAEVGTATAMSAAAQAFIDFGNLREIESAAEIGLEHQLGLTCDPIFGQVQIPCIQRNAMGASKAYLAAKLARKISNEEKVSFDEVVEVMYQTGKDLAHEYRETSLGGLAKLHSKNKEIK